MWPSTEDEPAWGDPLHGGRAPIPAGWNSTGRTGWYMGHLHPGEQSPYDDLATWQVIGSAERTTPSVPSPAPEPDAVVGTGTDALAVYDAG